MIALNISVYKPCLEENDEVCGGMNNLWWTVYLQSKASVIWASLWTLFVQNFISTKRLYTFMNAFD